MLPMPATSRLFMMNALTGALRPAASRCSVRPVNCGPNGSIPSRAENSASNSAARAAGQTTMEPNRRLSL